MALARNHLSGGTGSTSAAASTSPTALAWMIATVVTQRYWGGDAQVPTCTDNSGVNTWTQIASGVSTTGASLRVTLFKCQAVASPGTFTVTAASGTAGQMVISIEEFTGADSDLSNISPAATSTAGSPSATLPSSPSASSIVLGSYGCYQLNTITLPSGYTQIVQLTSAATRLNTCYHQTTGTGAAWSSTNAESCAVLLEVKAQASGGTVALDTGAVTVAGSDAQARSTAVLDTGGATIAGSDVQVPESVTLDSGAVAIAGSDLLAAVRPALDAGGVVVAGSDITAPVAATLDTGGVTAAGGDLLGAATATLDAGAAMVAGSDVAAGGTTSVTLDSGAVAVAGIDLLAATSVILDTGGVAAAGSDLSAAARPTLDTGAATAAGGDLAGAAAAGLDNGAVTVAGIDLSAALAALLDAGGITVAGSDIEAGSAAPIVAARQRGLIVNVGRLMTP